MRSCDCLVLLAFNPKGGYSDIVNYHSPEFSYHLFTVRAAACDGLVQGCDKAKEDSKSVIGESRAWALMAGVE